MTVLITTGSRLGMRALGGGGRTTASSYEQIAGYLRQSLGTEHAALFAQPSERPGEIDWYTGFDSTERPVRLAHAAPAQRGPAVAMLDRLMADITAKADELAAKDNQSDRILGEMLRLALEVPSEEDVWIVGTQPVLTSWGHVRDVSRPQNILRALIQKAAVREAPRAPIAGRPDSAIAGPVPAARGREGRSFWLASLWLVFALLMTAVGVVLLKGCALGLPGSVTGWFIDFCPETTNPQLLALLADERAQQGLLQDELDRLNREAGLKQQECELTTPANPTQPENPQPQQQPEPQRPQETPPQETPQPKADDELKIPPRPSDADPLKFLEGCWRSDAGVVERRTRLPITVTYCFDANGVGMRTEVYADGKTCRGGARARLNNGALSIRADRAPCPDGSSFVAETTQCKPDPDGTASCDISAADEPTPSVVGHRFHRTPPP